MACTNQSSILILGYTSHHIDFRKKMLLPGPEFNNEKFDRSIESVDNQHYIADDGALFAFVKIKSDYHFAKISSDSSLSLTLEPVFDRMEWIYYR